MKTLLQDWAAKWALYSPDKIALKEYETGKIMTYAAFNRLGNAAAYYLQKTYNIQKGDRVAVLAEYSLEYVVLFTAAQKAGFIIVPLNYRLTQKEIAYLLGDSEPKLIVFEEKFSQIFATTSTSARFETSPTFGDIETLNILNFSQNIHNQTVETFDIVPVDENDPVFILYTSGTTGFPKGAIYSHKMLFWNSINTAMSLIINSDSRTLNVMPPFHTGGWNVLLTPFLHHGGYTCLLKKFDAAAILRLLQTERCTLFMGVPTMLKMMADLPEFDTAAFPDLHYIIVGGEPMPIPLIEKWATKNVAIRQGFGMTEVGPNLFSLHQDDALRKKGSIGRANFYVETRIVDEKGEICDNGELLLRGPMVTPGYWQKGKVTQKSIVDDWFHTGDRVRCDEEGYFYVIDRIKNMYISGGENVYPAEIERVILTNASVSEVATIGVPDAQWGEVGKAFIVKKEDLTEEDLRAFLKKNVAKFKIPKYIVFVDALPKNGAGKIDRQELKQRSTN